MLSAIKAVSSSRIYILKIVYNISILIILQIGTALEFVVGSHFSWPACMANVSNSHEEKHLLIIELLNVLFNIILR